MEDASLRHRTLKGVKWQSISFFFAQVAMNLMSIIIARLLLKDEVGVIALTLVITYFLSLLNDLGLAYALIQRREITDKHISTVFTVNIGLGFFSVILLFLLSPYIAIFLKAPLLSSILRLFSITFLFDSLRTTQRSIMLKDMQFKKVAIIDIIGVILVISISITLAFYGYGAWSIVCGYIASAIIKSILYWFFSTRKPKPAFDRQCFRELFSFSVGILGSNIMNQLSTNLDTILIGRLLGTVNVGVYSLSFRISYTISNQINGILTNVLLPAFSEIQDNILKIKESYLYIIKQVSMIAMPLMLWLIIISPEFVKVILTDKWIEAIPIIQLLSINGLMSAIGGGLWATILTALGYSKKVFYLTSIRVIVLCIFVFIGSYKGIIGVAFLVAIYGIGFQFIYQYTINKNINLSIISYLKSLFPASVSTICMVAVLIIAKFMLYKLNLISDLIVLVSITLLGIISYIVFLRLLFRSEFQNAIATIKSGLH